MDRILKDYDAVKEQVAQRYEVKDAFHYLNSVLLQMTKKMQLIKLLKM